MNQTLYHDFWNSYKWPVGLHILFGTLSIFFLFWVLFNLINSKYTDKSLRMSGNSMIGFIAFVATGWIINIASGSFLEVFGQGHPCYKLLLLLSQLKGMLFIIIPLLSFIVYLEFLYIANNGISFVTNIIKSIKWQIITIIIVLVIMAFSGFIFIYLLGSFAGGSP